MTVVTSSGPSRRERKKAAVRNRIITVAIDLFSRHGIDVVTVDQIAEAADIGKGTIYNYFQTKEDIVVAFMVDVERRVQAKLARFTRSKAPLESILTEFVLLQFRHKARHREFVRVFLGHMFVHTGQFIPYMAEMQKFIDPPLEALFRGLQESGAIRADVNLPELILAFKSMQLGLTAMWVIEGPPFKETKRVLREQMRLFSQGLMARK
ncbi:MAG: TetR/AcrR family transcriptional regulator [Acidobacteriota bacterium]